MRFSIVIPVYNVAPYLEACLDSVRAQSLEDWECICVDDGSTDGSGAMLDEVAAKDGRFRVLHKANGGVSSARNAALGIAAGDWFLFLDADDVWREDCLANVAAVIDSHPEAELVGFGMCPFRGERPEWDDVPPSAVSVPIDGEVDNELLKVSLPQLAYCRAKFHDLRFKPLSVGEDLVFLCMAFSRACSCWLVARQEMGYRLRPGSATRSAPTPAKLRDVVSFDVEMFQILEASGKRVGFGFWLCRGNLWIEAVPGILLRQRGDGWNAAWNAWLDSMSVAAELKMFSGWQRFVARTVARTRSKAVVRLLCLFPAWLHRKGIVRRPNPT